jgi:tRNA pseudouridine55 synthase
VEGYLLIDKPEGISSFRVVAIARRSLSEATGSKVKVGHTGTLDPMASGLLILVVGKYTKRAADFSKLDKIYEAELSLGAVSSTADREGTITKKSSHQPTEGDVAKTLNNFIGDITQTPPAFSAIKVGGQRAYKLAREGKPVELKARPAKVFAIENISYNYPKLSFTVHVSSGTYIRSLAEDIGEALGTGAYLSALRRTKVGRYSVNDTVPVTKNQINHHQLLKNLQNRLPKHL